MNISSLILTAPLAAITLSAVETSTTTRVQELAATLAAKHINSPHWAEIYSYLQDMQWDGINSAVCNGDTLLVYALNTPDLGLCNAEDIGTILLAGANVHIAEEATGNTPLHLAAKSQDYAIALRLIACGANLTVKNKEGKTAADLAEEPHLKLLLSTGIPCELVTKKAKDTYKKALTGNADACYEIGLLYNSGEGSDVNPMVNWIGGLEPLRDMSHFWQKLAAEKGHINAIANLGMLYYWGAEGVTQNEMLGYTLLKKAAELGHETAAEILQGAQTPSGINMPATLHRGCKLIFKGEHSESGDICTMVFGENGVSPLSVMYYKPVSANMAELGFRSGSLIFNGTILFEAQNGNNYSGRIGGTIIDTTHGALEIFPLTFELNVPSK